MISRYIEAVNFIIKRECEIADISAFKGVIELIFFCLRRVSEIPEVLYKRVFYYVMHIIEMKRHIEGI